MISTSPKKKEQKKKNLHLALCFDEWRGTFFLFFFNTVNETVFPPSEENINRHAA